MCQINKEENNKCTYTAYTPSGQWKHYIYTPQPLPISYESALQVLFQYSAKQKKPVTAAAQSLESAQKIPYNEYFYLARMY